VEGSGDEKWDQDQMSDLLDGLSASDRLESEAPLCPDKWPVGQKGRH
jgi:hypothetical protein